MNQPLLIVIIAGMITGCSGGVLRDVLCNDVPLLFRSELYASVSVATGALYLAGLRGDLNAELATLAAFVVGIVFRLLAIQLSVGNAEIRLLQRLELSRTAPSALVLLRRITVSRSFPSRLRAYSA